MAELLPANVKRVAFVEGGIVLPDGDVCLLDAEATSESVTEAMKAQDVKGPSVFLHRLEDKTLYGVHLAWDNRTPPDKWWLQDTGPLEPVEPIDPIKPIDPKIVPTK